MFKNRTYDKDFYSKLIRLTVPIAFQALMLASVAVADAFMLGNVEQNSMSAVSLATQFQFIQNMILMGITSTTAILGAQYWGKEDRKALNDIFCIGLGFSVLVSALTFIGCVFFPKYLMLVFTDDAVLVEIGAEYLRVAGWSYLITGISQVYLTIMKVSDHAKQSAVIASGSVIINIIMNAVLIYGLLGAPALGVEGAAYATLIARIVEIIWAVATSFKADYICPNLLGLIVWNRLLLIDFVKCAWPLLGAALFWGVGFTSYSAFMGHLGQDAAAANAVTAVVRDLICCLCDGISAGAGIIVGNELGAGRLDKGKEYGIRLAKIAFGCGAFSTVVMLILTPFVIHFVKLTQQAASYLTGMMIIMAFYMIGRAVNTIIINGIFAAGGDTLFDMYSLAITMWCIAVPLAALGTFVLHFPVLIVYACTCLDEVGKIPWVMHHFRKYKWVKDLTRDTVLE